MPWRMFSNVEGGQYFGDVQYLGRCSISWRMFDTVKDVEYLGGCSVLLRMFSTFEDVQYLGGYSVLWGYTISTMEEYHKYCAR